MSDPKSEDERRAKLFVAGALSAGVVHELANSLALAESSLYLAQRSLEDRAALERHLGVIAAEIRKAQMVTTSVMRLARGEPPQCELVTVSDLIAAARRNAELPANVTFRAEVEPEALTLTCDAVLVERVLTNLLLNARAALRSRPEGEIVVRSFREKEQSWVTVVDDGEGIDDEQMQHMFEPLVTNKVDGTGLGLTLCRAIVHAHGGDIAATSTPASGTTFRFWLP